MRCASIQKAACPTQGLYQILGNLAFDYEDTNLRAYYPANAPAWKTPILSEAIDYDKRILHLQLASKQSYLVHVFTVRVN